LILQLKTNHEELGFQDYRGFLSLCRQCTDYCISTGYDHFISNPFHSTLYRNILPCASK